MSGPIQHLRVDDISLAPTQAELRVTVTLDREWRNEEVRGRLMGPRCRFSNTVEIAYPLRPLPSSTPDLRSRAFRVIIPEASWWDLQSPFLYEGPLELWHDEQCIARTWISHGLRSLTLGPKGLRLNGRPVDVMGKEIESATAEDFACWRSEGINLLVASVRVETEVLWLLGDQSGMLVVGRLPDSAPQTRERVAILSEHASCLGWLLPESADGEWIAKGMLVRGIDLSALARLREPIDPAQGRQ